MHQPTHGLRGDYEVGTGSRPEGRDLMAAWAIAAVVILVLSLPL